MSEASSIHVDTSGMTMGELRDLVVWFANVAGDSSLSIEQQGFLAEVAMGVYTVLERRTIESLEPDDNGEEGG